MVELARGRGVDARVADATALPFDDACFDVVAAMWMLYHVLTWMARWRKSAACFARVACSWP